VGFFVHLLLSAASPQDSAGTSKRPGQKGLSPKGIARGRATLSAQASAASSPIAKLLNSIYPQKTGISLWKTTRKTLTTKQMRVMPENWAMV